MSTETSYESALAMLLEVCRPGPVEPVPLRDSHHRVLATAVTATVALPPDANSAMDGYAVRATDVERRTVLPCTQLVAAGTPPAPLDPGWAAPIATGALVPMGADTVVPIEAAQMEGDRVVLIGPLRVGEHIRRAGSDVMPGATVAWPGLRVGPGEAAMFAAIGLLEVQVYRQPRVAILATGSELVPFEQTPGAAQIRESNSIALAFACQRAGADVTLLGIARDDETELRDLLRDGLGYDLLVTSGGVSVGQRDLVRATLTELGATERFWRVAVKPGKPCVLATTETCVVMGLPGNPASALVGMSLFVQPAIQALGGVARPAPIFETAIAEGVWPAAVGRLHAVRCRTRRSPDGCVCIPSGDQGSHRIDSLVAADALALIPAGQGVRPGDAVVLTATGWSA